MALPNKKFTDRLKDRNDSLKQQATRLQRLALQRKEVPAAPAARAADALAGPSLPTPKPTRPMVAAVRMEGDSIVSLLLPDAGGAQHLAPALRQMVDLYLQAAQCGTREVLLLWPGSLECLPLIHAIATIEYWAQGYKQGFRSLFYPATSATFRRLNHVFAEREDIHAMNNEVREISVEGRNPAVKQGCVQKDLMLFALNSLKAAAKAADLQPSLNELLPHFYLETGESKEIEGQNYGGSYLNLLLSKLSNLGHAKALRETTLPELGAAKTAPDAVFALSYSMSKAQIEQALRTLKMLGRVDVVLVDATRSAFDRSERLQYRIASFVRLVDEVFGADGPGILMVTTDPRQMTVLRAALQRETPAHALAAQVRIGATKALCYPGNDLGLHTADDLPIALDPAGIKVEITDRESAKLLISAYRLTQERGTPTTVIDALAAASKFVQTMANLPSSAELLHQWLHESLAGDGQRRHFDWIAHRNRVKGTLGEVAVDARGRIESWLKKADALLAAQSDGTPLARAMLDRIKTRAKQGKVLVVVQSRFYADLAHEYFLRDPDSERLDGRVQFTALRMMEAKLATGGSTQMIVCALSPDLLRWIVTTKTLPGPVDLLLTQQTAQGANFALGPVLQFEAFRPYFDRLHAIHDPIQHAHGAINAVMPDFDYQAPAFALTPTGSGEGGGGDGGEGCGRGTNDFVAVVLDDGRRFSFGHGSRVYVYDPAAKESRALGFRPSTAEKLQPGHLLFLMSEEMREQAEATFAAAGVTFDEAAKYEQLLREYHAQVLQRVRERFAGNVAEAARAIREGMLDLNLEQDATTIRYWISLKHAAKTPFDDLRPQAPRHFPTFQAFMGVLGFDSVSIQTFWDGAVKRVRGTRISDGVNLGEHYDRVLFDPDGAATYDRLTPEVLNTLRASALDNVYEVTGVSFGTTRPKG